MLPKPIIIDLSEWQVSDQIDYNKLSRQIAGVIVRVQYGSNWIDKQFRQHLTEFKKRQVPVAVYAWVRGTSRADMQQEARDFYQRAIAFEPNFWWLDVEEKSMTDMRLGCEAYRQELKRCGAKNVGVYVANHLFSDFHLDVAKFDGLWIPIYGRNDGEYNGADPTATSQYDLHQYTSCGHLTGYLGNLDLNRIVHKGFAYFFDKEGGIKMKSLKTTVAGVNLRKMPKVADNILAKLPKGAQIDINDIVIGDGFVWGIQPRADGSVAYVDIGKSVAWIN